MVIGITWWIKASTMIVDDWNQENKFNPKILEIAVSNRLKNWIAKSKK